MTFVQKFAVALGLLLSLFSSSWAACPVLAIDGDLFELQEDVATYQVQLNELKKDLIQLGEDADVELADAPKVSDLNTFILDGCNDLKLFRKTIWFNRGDLRFVDFSKWKRQRCVFSWMLVMCLRR